MDYWLYYTVNKIFRMPAPPRRMHAKYFLESGKIGLGSNTSLGSTQPQTKEDLGTGKLCGSSWRLNSHGEL